ncbi:peptidase inhibitor family I36 protein [Actinomadura decatromicini]|uniref:peptidase inhibitor family I36 protein n=1 Tax=Actinomadura decatromicini TaxID=2604572 RepID=UPI001FE4A5FE|nr:peptidase inhibitor family I36 protein [Actinomadura decatromicini]
MRTTRIAVAGLAVAGLAALLTLAAAQADAARVGTARVGTARVGTRVAAWQGSCAKGDFCVWSGKDGTGTRCAWSGDDPDWWGGSVRCRPTFLVSSYWNNGYTGSYSKVKVYEFANYEAYWGTISAGQRGSFWEGQLMRSHKWVN